MTSVHGPGPARRPDTRFGMLEILQAGFFGPGSGRNSTDSRFVTSSSNIGLLESFSGNSSSASRTLPSLARVANSNTEKPSMGSFFSVGTGKNSTDSRFNHNNEYYP